MAYTTRFGKLIKTGRHGIPQPARFHTEKGQHGGACNRTACQRPNTAYWYNHSTEKYYCRECAHWLNTDEFNRRDAMNLYGHDLCTFDADGIHSGR